MGGYTPNSSTSSLHNPVSYSFGGAAGFPLYGAGNAGAGLNLTATHMGYASGSSGGSWTSYLSSSGDFYLGGPNGLVGLSWVAATGNLSIGNYVAASATSSMLANYDTSSLLSLADTSSMLANYDTSSLTTNASTSPL